MVKRFEDFIVWKKSMQLSIEIYKNLWDCKVLDFGIKFKDLEFLFHPILPRDLKDSTTKKKFNFIILQKVLVVN